MGTTNQPQSPQDQQAQEFQPQESDLSINSVLRPVIDAAPIDQKVKSVILNGFAPFEEELKKWEDQAYKITVTDAAQVSLMREAGEMRKAIKKMLRIPAEKVKDALKRDAIDYGKAVQSVYNFIEEKCERMEAHLALQEKFAERIEKERQDALAQKRISELEPYKEFVPIGLDFGTMTESNYEILLNSCIAQMEAKTKREQEAEKARILQEQISALQAKRSAEVAPLSRFAGEESDKLLSLGSMSDEEYMSFVEKLSEKESMHQQEQLRILEENQKLKAAQEIKDARTMKLTEIGLNYTGQNFRYKDLIVAAPYIFEIDEKEFEEELAKAKSSIENIISEEARQAEIDKQKQKGVDEKQRQLEAENKRLKEESDRKKELKRLQDLAPDKDKIKHYISCLKSIELPQLEKQESKDLMGAIVTLVNKIEAFAHEKLEKL